MAAVHIFFFVKINSPGPDLNVNLCRPVPLKADDLTNSAEVTTWQQSFRKPYSSLS